MEVDEFARRQIFAVSQRVLRAAEVINVLPTPLEAVGRALGIHETIDMAALPADLVVKKPSALKRILGAYLFRADTVFIDLNQPKPRARFTLGHEVGHRMLPWHQRAYYLDGEKELLPEVEDYLEQEANLAASYLIFQGTRFNERALDFQTSISTPLRLAPDFGASYHAAIRHYVDHHPDDLALLVSGRYPHWDGTLPVWTASESPSFERRFGTARSVFLAGRPAIPPDGRIAISRLMAQANVLSVSREVDVRVQDLNGRWHPFTAECWFNRRCYFTLLSRQRLWNLGRRIFVVGNPFTGGPGPTAN